MHPDLELFLQSIFDAIEPTAGEIGRVVVEPDYNVAPDERDRERLGPELAGCLEEHGSSLDSFEPAAKYTALKKYVRCIRPHADHVQGAWVEVAPPGNWI